MKDHIHTIPVLDALRDPGGCPFCMMQKNLDSLAVDFIMGPAYMDEDIRDKTDEAGFCAGHLQKLYAVQNRLGAALLLHTHFKRMQKYLEGPAAVSAAERNPDNPQGRRFAKENVLGKGFFKKTVSSASKMAGQIASQQNRCYLCEKVEDTFNRYVDTFFYMWPREKEMRKLVQTLPGFCLPHYGMMMAKAEISLSKKHLESFLSIVVPLQQGAMAKLEGDLDWFIQKFDYRNNDAPWKNSKDAIIRAVAMLKGITVE